MKKKKIDQNAPKVVSIFSGCGGLDLGFHMEGYNTIWANDFAEWAVKSFKKNFGDVIRYEDITKINPYTDKSIPDCVCFGWLSMSGFLNYLETTWTKWFKRWFV